MGTPPPQKHPLWLFLLGTGRAVEKQGGSQSLASENKGEGGLVEEWTAEVAAQPGGATQASSYQIGVDRVLLSTNFED